MRNDEMNEGQKFIIPKDEKNLALLTLAKKGFLYLHGPVNEEMADYVRDSLMILTHEPPADGVLTVKISSPGGAVQEGLEIHDQFMMYALETGIRVEGLAIGKACSAAAMFLLQGCTYRLATENCAIMCHNALSIDIITEHDLNSIGWRTKMLRELGTIKGQAKTILMRRTKRSEQEILKLLTKGRFMTAKEAFDFGLLDGVLEFKFKEPEEEMDATKKAKEDADFSNEESENGLSNVLTNLWKRYKR